MAWVPVQNIGERHPKIPAAKRALGKFSYGKGLGDTDIYTAEFGVALRQWQANIHVQVAFKGRPGPDVNQIGIFDWETQVQLGVIQPAVSTKPVVFTVAGHLGDMLTGPAYFGAHVIEEQGAVRVQPIGYDNTSLPFKNSTGVTELNRVVNDPVILPPGTPWALSSHSQGGIVASTYFLQQIRPNQDRWPYSHFRGAVSYGNPYREKGVCAEWVPDPPKPDRQGIADRRMENTPDTWKEVSRSGDLYADNTADNTGEMKTAIYRAVQNEWTGKDSLAEQVGEIVGNGGPELWAVFVAIASGIKGAANLDKHNVFDLGPGIEHLRRILA